MNEAIEPSAASFVDRLRLDIRPVSLGKTTGLRGPTLYRLKEVRICEAIAQSAASGSGSA